MAVQPQRPIGGLAGMLDVNSERLRSLEQRRTFVPGGIVNPGPILETSSASTTPTYPGIEYTTTAGPSGLILVFAQAFVSSPGFSDDTANLFVSMDGATGVEIAVTTGNPPSAGNLNNNPFLYGNIAFSVAVDTAHTLSLGLLSLGSGDTYTWTDLFLVAWAL